MALEKPSELYGQHKISATLLDIMHSPAGRPQQVLIFAQRKIYSHWATVNFTQWSDASLILATIHLVLG